MMSSKTKFCLFLAVLVFALVSQAKAIPSVVSTLTIKGKAYYNPNGGEDTPLPGGTVISKVRFYVGGEQQHETGGIRVADSNGNWEIQIPCSMDVGGPLYSYYEVDARPINGDVDWGGGSGGINCYTQNRS